MCISTLLCDQNGEPWIHHRLQAVGSETSSDFPSMGQGTGQDSDRNTRLSETQELHLSIHFLLQAEKGERQQWKRRLVPDHNILVVHNSVAN